MTMMTCLHSLIEFVPIFTALCLVVYVMGSENQLTKQSVKTNNIPVALVLQWPVLESDEKVFEGNDNRIVKRDALREPRTGSTSRCYADEYLDSTLQTCQYCTRCREGYQHRVSDPEREACGFGHGTSLHCDQCPDGFYQDRVDYHILQCEPCSSCAPGAEVVQGCTKQRNTVCGRSCQPGWFPHDIGCIKCTHRTDHQNCRQVTLTPGGTVVMKTTLPPIVRTTTQSPSQGLQHFSPSPTQEAPSEVPATGKSKLAWSNLGTILLIVGGIIAVIVFLCIWYYRRNHTNRCRRISAQDKSVDGHISTGDVWTGVPTSPSETSSGMVVLNGDSSARYVAIPINEDDTGPSTVTPPNIPPDPPGSITNPPPGITEPRVPEHGTPPCSHGNSWSNIQPSTHSSAATPTGGSGTLTTADGNTLESSSLLCSAPGTLMSGPEGGYVERTSSMVIQEDQEDCDGHLTDHQSEVDEIRPLRSFPE